MAYFHNKKSLVLGGTSGIGLAIARALVDKGSEVIVGSRRGQCDGLPAEKIDVLDREALKCCSQNKGNRFLDQCRNRGRTCGGVHLWK